MDGRTDRQIDRGIIEKERKKKKESTGIQPSENCNKLSPMSILPDEFRSEVLTKCIASHVKNTSTYSQIMRTAD